MSISENLKNFNKNLPKHVILVAVSKTKPIADLQEAYNAGQRIFGENKIQEMTDKWEQLPKDIEWHMIGHIQTNKVKYMAPYVSLIHAVDSLKLLKEINKQAAKKKRVINCLLQLKIAQEDSKFGLSKEDVMSLIETPEFQTFENITIVGLMGMASFTKDQSQIKSEFDFLQNTFNELSDTKRSNFDLKNISMGMSGDYNIAIESGSTMIRVGSAIFGSRNYN